MSGFNRLLDDEVDAKLVWVGSNETFINLFKSLEPLMKRNVSYLGVVNNVRDYMAAADAICLSSKMEGMPMTLIEGFSVGCPTISTPVGGIRNIINDGENGLLSNDLTIDSYFQKLKVFCEMNREQRQHLKSNTLASWKKYSIVECTKKYKRLYSRK